jgi:hypothetical protein
MSRDQMRQLQPGQWVYAGDKDSKGQFLGVKKNDVVVVAWYGNAKGHRSYYDYVRSLRQFAKGC